MIKGFNGWTLIAGMAYEFLTTKKAGSGFASKSRSFTKKKK
jgi:hypothetical protein